MTLITRRAALGGLACLPAMPPSAAAQLGDRQAALDAYRDVSTPQERLEHHLLMAAQALDDLCPTDNCRWMILGGGEPRRFNPRFRAVRFDPYRGYSDPRLPDGIRQEHDTILFSRPNPWCGL